MAVTKANVVGSDNLLSAITGNEIWGVTSLTYAFAVGGNSTIASSVAANVSGGTFLALSGTDPVGRDVVASLGEFEKVSGLRFTVSTDFVAADLKFLGYNFGSLGEADFPGDNRKQPSTTDFESFVRLNTANADVQRGAGTGSSFAKFLVLHETGHALGLAHPHDTGNGSNTMPSTFGAFTFNNDDPLAGC